MGLMDVFAKNVKCVIDIPHDLTRDELKNRLLTEMPSIFGAYAFICHDRDVKDDGTPKTLHFHLIGVDTNARSKRLGTYLNLLSKVLNVPKEVISVRPSLNLPEDIRYLTHVNNPEKAQYQDTEVFVSDESWYVQQYNMYGNVNLVSYMQLYDTVRACQGKYHDIACALGLDTLHKYRLEINDLIRTYDFSDPDDVKEKSAIIKGEKNESKSVSDSVLG